MTPAMYGLVFGATFLADVAWARYVGHVAAGSRWSAGIWSVILFLLGAFAVVSYTTNKMLLIPATIGAFLGTVVGVPTWRK
jgi:hypothetical protein